MNQAADRTYLPALDGIRAFAVFAVVLYHAEAVGSASPIFGGGFLGVSVFFTLSGFLIGGQLLREHESTGSVGFSGFARRRIARLAPAALFTIAAVVLVSRTSWAAWGVPAGFAPSDAIGAVWNITNWQLIAMSNASIFRLIHPLTHFWSLAVEAQLYIVLAFVCRALTSRPLRRALIITASAGWVLSAAIAIVVHGSVRREEFGTDIRLAEFAAGALLAAALPRLRDAIKSRRLMADLCALSATMAFIVLALTAGREDRWLQTGGYALLSLVWVGWVVGATEGTLMPRLLAARPLAFVGTVSFSLYLVHWPIVLMLKDHSLLIRLLVSFAAGVALHFAVERPARRALAARPTRQVVLSWLGAAAVATVLAGVMNTAIG